jgi:hypothetical protein
MGGLQRGLRDTSQVLVDGVQIDRVLQPGPAQKNCSTRVGADVPARASPAAFKILTLPPSAGNWKVSTAPRSCVADWHGIARQANACRQ